MMPGRHAGDPLDRARARVRESGGAELLERLEHLEASRGPRPAPEPPAPPAPGTRPDYDVVLAGGGLSILLAPVLADAGLSVAVLERGRAGVVHREWNASRPELEALTRAGLFTEAEVDALVIARYDHGVCRWHGGGAYPVRGVLDHAVDAGRLLPEVRRRAEARGVTFLDHHPVVGEAAGRDALAVSVDLGGRRETVVARILVDGRGAASPYATADLLCPTVGGVLGSVDQDPQVGDILATTEDVEDGRQHIWEAFPGRPGETAVYLFYYAPAARVRPGALLSLYARFFERRPGYLAGEGRLLRPTFGYIPGWSRLTPAPRAPGRRVVLVGDAAARHSPLTYCGFGAMLRSLAPASEGIARAVDGGARGSVVDDRSIHAGTGALSALMARPDPDPARAADLNRLLDAAFATLHDDLGQADYAALLQDRMDPRTFLRFLRLTAAKRPEVYRQVFRRLGAAKVARWGAGLARAGIRG